jgi:N-acetylmuramoyl-L-alanine amidase
MAYRDRLRRHLVHAAVRENLAVMKSVPPPPLRRGRRWLGAAARGYRVLIGPALLLLAVGVLASGTGGAVTPRRGDSLEALSARVAAEVPQPVHAAAFSLGVRRIILDPGHGGDDPGAHAAADFSEKQVTLDVAQRLRALLQESGLDVLMTREHDESVSLRERALFANTARGDLFVSIHVNAVPSRERCGPETYYLGPGEDPWIEQLAVRENQESGYSLVDFRRLLHGLYAHVRREESRRFADAVQRGLVAFLRRSDPGLKDNGVKTAPFLVLVATEMPGVLTELSCLSNDEEQAKGLADPVQRQNIARGLFVGIRAYADARNRLGSRGSS